MSRRPQVDANKAAANQNTLKQLVKLEGNKSCADCKKNKHPRWASWNLGIFVCIRCSGIHRGMGTHISRVKSVDLDAWTDEQLQSMIRWGNTRANKYWESKLAPGHVPADAKMENFIRTKYESKRWVAEGPMPDPATLDAGDDDAPLNVVQEKAKLDRASSLRSPAVAGPAIRKPTNNNIDLFADDSGPPARPSTTEPQSSGRVPPVRAPAAPAQQPQPPKPAPKQNESLLGLDFFGGTQSAPPARPSSASNATGALPQRTDLKQSILSLYASVPKAAPVSQAPPPQTFAGVNPQQSSNGLSDAFSTLNFGPPQAAPAPAKPAPFSGLSSPSFSGLSSPSARQTTAAPSLLSGGSFFDPKPTAPPQTMASNIVSKAAPRTSGGFGDFGDFTSATPSPPPVAKPAPPPASSAMGDLFDFSGPTTTTSPPPPAKPIAAPAPPKQTIASKPASSKPPPINMSSYTSNSAFNLSAPAPAPAKPAAPAATNYAAMSDPWGGDNAWSTPDPAPSKPAAPKPISTAPPSTATASAPVKAPATTALSDDFGGWGSNDVSAAPARPAMTSAVSAASDGFGAWGSNDTVPSPPAAATTTTASSGTGRPAVTQDDDFGGWSSASPVAVSAQPASQAAAKPFGGAAQNNDLFSNVWE